jgi:hypothetical protein
MKPNDERPDLSRSGHSRREVDVPSGLAVCRCGARSTVLTPKMFGGLMRSRLWCRRCYDRAGRRAILLGRVIGWAVSLVLVAALAWWKLRR